MLEDARRLDEAKFIIFHTTCQPPNWHHYVAIGPSIDFPFAEPCSSGESTSVPVLMRDERLAAREWVKPNDEDRKYAP